MGILSRQGIRLGRRTFCASTAAVVLSPAVAFAGTIRISVAEFPDAVSTPALIAALKIAAAKVPGATAEIKTALFARSMAAMMDGSADLHIPMLRPPSDAGVPWTASAATMYHVPFVLYTNADKPLDRANLAKYKIETEVAHVGYFDFPVVPSAGIDSSLQKVAAGRIDGYVFAGNITDPILQKLGLTNIRRAFYKTFDATAVMLKENRSGPADQFFIQAMAAVAEDNEFHAATEKALSGYKGPDWHL